MPTLGSLKDLVTIDDTYRCVMRKPTKHTTLHSETVECVYSVRAIESFDDQGNSGPLFAVATLKSMTTKPKAKSKASKRKTEALCQSMPKKCKNPNATAVVKTWPVSDGGGMVVQLSRQKRNHTFLFMVAPERALYEAKNKRGHFSFHVVSTKNHEIVIPRGQNYSRHIDMINEIHRLWPHTKIDHTSINDA